jgi:hypothetical protein
VCTRRSGAEGLQILQHLGIPEALCGIDIGNSIRHGDVPDPSISSSRYPQVLLETRHSTGGASLVLLVTGYSPGIEIRFEDLGSEVVISRFRVVSIFLETVSVPEQRQSTVS